MGGFGRSGGGDQGAAAQFCSQRIALDGAVDDLEKRQGALVAAMRRGKVLLIQSALTLAKIAVAFCEISAKYCCADF